MPYCKIWCNCHFIHNYITFHTSWNQMETFSTYLAICAGNSPVNSLHKGQGCRALMLFFDLRLNKRLSKQSWGWWFETPSRPLWRHNNTIEYRSRNEISNVWNTISSIVFMYYMCHHWYYCGLQVYILSEQLWLRQHYQSSIWGMYVSSQKGYVLYVEYMLCVVMN